MKHSRKKHMKVLPIKKRIMKKLDEIQRYREELEGILPSEEEYNANLTTRRACEKTMELMIECVLDVISMIISSEKLGLPEDEDNLIELLVRKKFISQKLAIIVKGMKGFQNILVHKYGEVKNEVAYEYMSSQLKDFDAFEKEIELYLQARK